MSIQDYFPDADPGPGYRSPDEREQEWADGLHTTSKGETKALGEMDTRHLTNTINKFRNEGHDVSALERELAKRNPDG